MDLQKLLKNLEKRGFTPHYFETAKEAADYLLGELHGETVGFGGSVTLDGMGLYESLKRDNAVFWHWKDKDVTRREINNRVTVYLTSANGVSESGELVNIDGSGNRVAATLFGPKRVIFVAGVNKVAPDLHGAIERAQNVASPLNCKRLGKKTPCAVNCDRCFDCASPDRVCRAMVVYMGKMQDSERTDVILVGESLGY